MQKPILARTIAPALVAVMLTGTPAAWTAAAQAAAASDAFDQNDATVKEPYRKAIKYGVAEYEARHFDEALGYFRRAHEISPNARTFRGIGMASFELRDYVTAVRTLTASLAEDRKPLSPEQRKETQELIERCQNFIAIYRLRTVPPDAEVTVDTAPPELQPDGTLMLGLGPHLFEARAKGYAPRTLSIQVRGRERQELVLELDPLVTNAAPAALDLRPDPAVAAATRPATADNRNAKIWLWTGAGAAALSIAAGIYWAKQNQAMSSCRNPRPGYQCDNQSMIELERNIGAGTTLVTGAAAIAALTVGLYSWKSATPPATTKRAFACSVGAFDVTCGGSF